MNDLEQQHEQRQQEQQQEKEPCSSSDDETTSFENDDNLLESLKRRLSRQGISSCSRLSMSTPVSINESNEDENDEYYSNDELALHDLRIDNRNHTRDNNITVITNNHISSGLPVSYINKPAASGDGSDIIASQMKGPCSNLTTSSKSLAKFFDIISRGQIKLTSTLNPFTLPEEALLFEPKPCDVLFDETRYIYLNTPLLYRELEPLTLMHKTMSKQFGLSNPLAIQRRTRIQIEAVPSQGASSTDSYTSLGRATVTRDKSERNFELQNGPNMTLDAQYLRALYAAEFDTQAAIDITWASYNYSMCSLPIFESDVAEDLQVGVAYWHGRDMNCRPLLIVRLNRLEYLNNDIHRVQKLFTFCFEFFLLYLCVAGRVENWIIILDCDGIGASGFPAPVIKKLSEMMSSRYRGRLFKLYLINTPKFLGWISSWMLSLVHSASVKKICILYTEFAKGLTDLIAPHQLETRYGGRSPDLINTFYPFHFFPGPFTPHTSPDDVKWQTAVPGLSSIVSTSIIAGACWFIPVNYLYSSHYTQHTNYSCDASAHCVAVSSGGGGHKFKSNKQKILNLPWVKSLQHQSLSTESTKWLRDFLSINTASCVTLNEVLVKCYDTTNKLADVGRPI